MNSCLIDKVRGCFLGGVVGDAMGGPTECMHYKKIQRLFGTVTEFLPYRPPSPVPHPGGALSETPGSYTDDTIGRIALARAVLEKGGRVTADDVAKTFLKELKPWLWWFPSTIPFYKMQVMGVEPRDGGLGHLQEGGNAYYTALGIINACNPEQAYWDTFDVSSIWKRGTARELVSAVQCAIAEAFKPTATIRSVVEAPLPYLGDEARRYMSRALDVADKCDSWHDFIPKAYEQLLYDHPNPFEQSQPSEPLEDRFISIDMREHVPMAFAMFYVAKGNPQDAALAAANYGRDSDSIGTSSTSIAGALRGARAFPKGWIDTVVTVNPEPDLEQMCVDLANVTRSNIAKLKQVIADVESLI